MDQTKMEAIVPCFYATGSRFLFPGPFDLLSKDSAAVLERESHSEVMTDFTVLSAKLVGTEKIGSRRFSRVSVRQQREGCDVTSTQTWIEENGRWRLVWLPKTELLAHQQDIEHKVSDLIATYDDWLARDPYALAPLSELVDLLRSGPDLVEFKMLEKLPVSRHGTPEQLVRRALKINPEDDMAIALGIQRAGSLGEARALFERVPRSACAWPHQAAFVIGRFADARELASFISKLGDDSPGIVAAVVSQLMVMEAPGPLQEYLTVSRTTTLRKHWEERNGQDDAATQAAMLALLLVQLPDHAAAISWRDYARMMAPENATVQKLLSGPKW